MAQAWRSLGAEQVTLIEASERLLPSEEPFAGVELAKAFQEQGIDVVTGARMIAASRAADDAPVTATLEDGREFIGDEILVAVGRRPRTQDLGLESVGIEPGGFIDVGDDLRVTGVEGGWLCHRRRERTCTPDSHGQIPCSLRCRSHPRKRN